MKKATKRYEFMGIIKPFLPEETRGNLLKIIKGFIVSAGGKIVKEDIWGKRHLAYEITGHREGYYIVFHFELSCDKVCQIEDELRMTKNLLRYIIIVTEK